jgi:hypothetical protein
MTSNGRRGSSALRGPAVWIWRLIPPSVRGADFLAFDDAVAAVVAGRTPTLLAEEGRAPCEAPPIRGSLASSKRNSTECGRYADRHRAPNGSACNPKTCTSVPWDEGRERRCPALREKALIRSAALGLHQGVAIPRLRRIDVEVCGNHIVISRQHDGRSSHVEFCRLYGSSSVGGALVVTGKVCRSREPRFSTSTKRSGMKPSKC